MTRGERVCAFLEKYCIVPEGSRVGQPMRLDPFQREFILRVYDNPAGTELAILSIAKKNAKTCLIAALVLAHVAGPEARLNSQLVSGAMSREQAGHVFEYARKMVELSAALKRVVRIVPSRKRIVGLALNVEYRALAADGKRIHGISPLVAILDEVGQVKGPRSEFVDAITTSQGAHESPLLLVISTQAASDADMLSIWIDNARTNDNPHTVLALYEAPDECELGDESAWRAANPALGTFRSLADMRKQAEKAIQIPSFEPTFRNLCLNQRVEASAPFVSRAIWKAGARDLVEHDGKMPVYVGLDLSSVDDLTALVAVWQAGGQWNVAPMFWMPEEGIRNRAKRDQQPYDTWAKQGFIQTTPGPTVDYDYVAAQLLEMAAGWNLKLLAFDRWRIDVFKAALSRAGASADFIERMQSFGQGYQSMSPAMDALQRELLAGRIAHADHPVLKMCAANAVVKFEKGATRPGDEAGNRKLDKSKSTGRIDGMVALVMAMGVAAGQQTPEPTYSVGFV